MVSSRRTRYVKKNQISLGHPSRFGHKPTFSSVRVVNFCFLVGCTHDAPGKLVLQLAHYQETSHTAIGYIYDRELNVVSLRPKAVVETRFVPGPGFYSVALAPSGTYYGVSRKNENTFVAMRADGTVIWSRDGLFAEEIPEVSPNEDKVAFRGRDATTGKSGLLLVADGGTSVRLLSPTAKYPSWSNDNSQVMYEDDQTVRVYATQNGKVTDVVHGTRPRWSPDGASVSVLRPDGRFCLFDLVGKIKKELMDGRDVDTRLYWSPNSQYLMYFKKGAFLDGVACSDGSRDLMIRRISDGTDGLLITLCLSRSHQDFRWLQVPQKTGPPNK